MNKIFSTTICTLMYVLFSHSFSHAMKLNDGNYKLSDAPLNETSDLTFTILTRIRSPYPWENFERICMLKTVRKTWENVINTNQEFIKKLLNIPPMHYASMTDDSNQIVDLKLQGHSTTEPDAYGFMPSHYAIACNKKSALKMLQIGSAIHFFEKSHSYPPYKDKNKNTEIFLNPYKDRRDSLERLFENSKRDEENKHGSLEELFENSRYGEKLMQAVKENNYITAMEILLKGRLFAFKVIKSIDFTQDNTTTKLILYCLLNFLENEYIMMSFGRINNNEENFNISPMPNPPKQAYHISYSYDFTLLHTLCSINQEKSFARLTQILQLPKININIENYGYKNTPLHIAANTGYLKAINALLNTKQCKINHTNNNGHSPLSYSVQNGHHECVDALIKNGADTTITVPGSKNLLHLAASNGHIKALDILLNTGKFNVNSVDENFFPPLYYSVQNGHYECVNKLIEKGANPTIIIPINEKPLPTAFCTEYLKALNALPKADKFHIKPVDENNSSHLYYNAQSGHYECFNRLIDDNSTDTTIIVLVNKNLLHAAAQSGYTRALDVLLRTGKFDINSKDENGFSSLYYSVYNGHLECVKKLIKYGADPAIDVNSTIITPMNKSLLHTAAYKGHAEVLKLLIPLLKQLIDQKNSSGDTPLCLAAYCGHSNIIELLSHYGTDTTLKTATRKTALNLAQEDKNEKTAKLLDADAVSKNQLHVAAHNGNLTTLITLLNTGKYNVNSVNEDGFSPLSYSVQNGHLECVKKLIEYGADPAIIVNKKNLLHLAASGGHDTILAILIPLLKQSINQKSILSRTPLLACALSNPHNAYLCIQLLINAGADINIKDHAKRTALDLARQYENKEIEKLLTSQQNS